MNQIVFCLLLLILGCAITTPRPVQEMSDTSGAIQAAKQVQADTLAPELYRQAQESFFKAKNAYKFKEFKEAKEYALQAQNYAERAEFESVKNGGNRNRTDPTPSGAEPEPTPSPAMPPAP